MKNLIVLAVTLSFFASCSSNKTGCPYWGENSTIQQKEIKDSQVSYALLDLCESTLKETEFCD